MKTKKLVLAALLLCGITSSGCAPVAIGAYAYNLSDKREARQTFLSDLHATNLEREKSGLEPIDICTAKKQFDPKCAEEDTSCPS